MWPKARLSVDIYRQAVRVEDTLVDDLDIQALVGKTPAEIELYLRRLGEDAVPTTKCG